MISSAMREKRIALPIVKDSSMTPFIIKDQNSLKPGKFGILEPNSLIPVKNSDIDLIIVPGVVFDQNGNRIGFGKGYFDNFLPGFNCPFIALAFDFQVINQVPAGKFDVPVDKIITESRVINCKKIT